jgi:PKD repeat protein
MYFLEQNNYRIRREDKTLQYKNKKNLYKIVFITILLGFIISLVGCNWLSFGLLNIFDPQAQIRVNYKGMNLEEGTIALEVYSLNEAEFIGSGFEYEYYVGTTKITSLTKTVGATFYVAPSTSPGTPGPITTIDLLLYYQEVQDYITSNPLITELSCTINLIGTDGAGHSISKSVTVDLPAIQPGIDFEPPTAVINVTPGTTGTEPFTVIFDAYGSTDDRGIASYAWDFGDGTTATGVMPDPHTYTESGSYIVKLTVTDYFGNEGIAFVTITAGEATAPTAVINVTPSTTGIEPFTVYFDASQSSGCCSIVSYDWDFGDGTPNGTEMTISHTYAVGTYIVVLTVTDSNGNMGYDSVTITVNASGAPAEITLEANPLTITTSGGNSIITATVKDAGGDPVDPTDVIFHASTGDTELSETIVTTSSGIASTIFTPSSEGGATISAQCGSLFTTIVVNYSPPPAP